MSQQFLMGLVMVDNLNRYPDLVEAEEYEEGRLWANRDKPK